MSSMKTHIIIGTLCTATALLTLNYLNYKPNINYLLLAPIIFLYSQLPDIDHQSSKVTLQVTATTLAITTYFIYTQQKTLALLTITPITIIWILRLFKQIKHRGFFHTYTAGIILSTPLLYLSIPLALYGLLCYSSHIIADQISTYLKRKKIINNY